MYFKVRFSITVLVLGLALGSCNVTKHLDTAKGERLLVSTSLDIKSEQRLSLSRRAALKYETGGLYKQLPNKKATTFIPIRPRVAAWYKYHNRTSKFARFVNAKYVEAPAIYDDELAMRTARNFENFMRLRGYFQATCTYKTDSIGDTKVKTKYFLNLGPLYTISSTTFVSHDQAVLRILHEIEPASYLKPDAALDGRQFDAEKLRITTALRNRGYANFIANFIEFTGDSVGTKTAVTVEVLPPRDDSTSRHQVFTYDDVQVFSSLVPDITSIRREDTIEGVHYFSAEQNFWIKPRHLSRAITFRPGDLFNQEEIDRTNRNLSTMGAFRFVSVRPQNDSIKKGQTDVFISFSPQKRIDTGGGADFNYSINGGGGFFGGTVGTSLINRNLLRGAELLQSSLQYTLEFNLAKDAPSIFFSNEFKFQNDLIVPRFIDYFGLWKGLNRINLGKDGANNRFFQRLTKEGQTKFSLTYDFLSVTEFYKYNLFKATYGYRLSVNKTHKYELDHIGVDLLDPTLDPTFINLCNSNPLLCLNFNPQLFTGVLMRSFSYVFTSPLNRYGARWQFMFNSEVSGLEVHLLNKAFAPQNDWNINGRSFAKFARGEVSGIYNRSFSKDVMVAFRINSGLIQPFGGDINTPYVKQFFVGGPASIRAWRIRQLGPGSFWDPTTVNFQPNFQAADFKFEANAEFRFPIFWWFKGAVFVDAGNVWALKENRLFPGAELRWDSYKTMAIGTGTGLRFDAGYFIIRLDMGLKVRRPYVFSNEYGQWVQWYRGQSFKQISNFNLAVGYPF